MLATGPAEGIEQVARDVVAALHRDLLDGVGHVLDGDGQEALGHLARIAILAERRRHGLELLGDDAGVQRLVAARPEHGREQLRLQLAEHDIGVGHRQRPALAVGRRSRMRAGRIRAYLEAALVEMQDRAAAGSHRVDAHHRRADTHARDFRIQRPLVGAGIVGDIGRGAAHVEADDLFLAGQARGFGHADDAAGRARQDRILALEEIGGGEPTRRHHELQRRRGGILCAGAERAGDAADIARQDRRQIGVDDRGVAAPDDLYQRRDLVADRDLRETGFFRQDAGALLVGRIAPGMHEDDGDGVDAVGPGGRQRVAGAGLVQFALQRAVGQHPLADFRHPLVELLWQDDFLGEDVRAGLVGDLQRVAETACDEQQRAVALALEQRVGGHRRAHAHRADAVRDDRRVAGQAEEVANAFKGGVLVDAGIFGEQLARMQAPVGIAADDVGEGAAPVDPEVPLAAVDCTHLRHSAQEFIFIGDLSTDYQCV